MSSLERDRVPSARPIAVKEVPLVDRIEEVKSLKETVDRALQGEGGLVFLYGEAGIGKTRLARERARDSFALDPLGMSDATAVSKITCRHRSALMVLNEKDG